MEHVDQAVRPALYLESPQETGRVLPVRSGEELLKDESLAGDIEWLVEGLFPFGGLSIVYGLPKSGKTTLLMNAVAAILAGMTFLDRATETCDVLWLDLEQHERLTRRKIEDEGAVNKLGQIWAYNGAPPQLTDVEATIVHLGARLVVADSLSSLLMLEDENDNAEITRRIALWRELTHRRNIAFIGIHHSRKSEGSFGTGMRGGNAILAISDVAVEVKRLHNEAEEDDGRRRLVGVSRYDEANETMTVQYQNGEFVLEASPVEKRQQAILTLIGTDALEAGILASRLHMRRRSAEEALRLLLADGRLRRLGAGHKGDPFRYSR